MMQAVFKRLFHFQEMILVLSLMALACLPSALSEIVRDAGVSLLIPLTLIGALIAWALATRNIDKTLSLFILVILGPLALYVRIGQMGSSLFEFTKQAFNMIPALFNWFINKIPFDPSVFISSREDLLLRAFTLSTRLSLWFTGLLNGIQIEDPVVRTLIWSVGLWLIAVWAGWQMYRNKRFLAGMLPSTIVLAFVLDYTGRELPILWYHLALLLFVYGLSNYINLQKRWSASQTDYAESTSVDTLILVGAMTFGLVSASFLVSTISLRDILADFRENRAGSNESQAQSLGLESIKDNFRVTGFDGGLPRSYLLTAGPQLSSQLAMTISTGDLPSMPASARPTVPRYYWRTLSYSIYTGSGWTNPSASAEDVPAEQALLEQPNLNHRIVREEVIFPNDSGGRLYWTGTLISADVPFQAAWFRQTEDDQFIDADMLAALAPVESYTAESILLDPTADELRESPSVYPDWVREQFLVVPDSVPERVRSLARDLTASEPNAYDRALAIQNYLREFPYTLEVGAPPAGRDVVDYFIFDLKQGYCDYYATSMAVLARAAGLPARIVVGYVNGTYDTERAQYLVTENYAHSWVEIYFADIGWVEFEPTASQPVIFYEEDIAPTEITEILPVERSWREQFATLFQRVRSNTWIPILFIFVCGILWIGFDSLRLSRLDPSRTIQLLYKRLRRLARPVTGSASSNQTAHLYSHALIERLSSIKTFSRLQEWIMPSYSEINQMTELYSLSLFAPIPPTRADANDVIKTWSRLRWRLLLANLLNGKSRSRLKRDN
ncbi:MAG: transglutaminase domain-containing protein [Anaerolineales bacterium]|nr:transglutaminase domain-containing protein [Anaerolineales bacterium]